MHRIAPSGRERDRRWWHAAGFGTIALALAATAPRAQGDSGFLTPDGEFALGAYFSRETIDEYELSGGKTSLAGDLVRDRTSVFAAYGLSDDLEVWLTASYGSNDADASSGVSDEAGLQDVLLGLRWRAWHPRAGPGRLALVLAPAVKAPLGDYDTDQATSLGDGQVDVLGRMVLQYLLDAGHFVAVETGYDVRFDEPEDEVPLAVTLGVTLWDRVTVTPFYSRIESLGGETLTSVGGGGPGGSGGRSFAVLEQDYVTVGVGLYARWTERAGVTASFARAIEGSNTGLGETLSIGLVLDVSPAPRARPR